MSLGDVDVAQSLQYIHPNKPLYSVIYECTTVRGSSESSHLNPAKERQLTDCQQ